MIRERKEKSKLQKEIENMQRQILEMEHLKKLDLQTSHNEYDRVSRELRVAQEEKKMLTAKLQEIQSEYDLNLKTFEHKKEEYDLYERELKKLQDKYRETMN